MSHNDKVSAFEKDFFCCMVVLFKTFLENNKPKKNENRSVAY